MAEIERLAVRKGTGICDRNGDEVGIVEDINLLGRAIGGQEETEPEGYVQAACNMPGCARELYIPFDAFGSCRENTCYLKYSADEIKRMGWEHKPGDL